MTPIYQAAEDAVLRARRVVELYTNPDAHKCGIVRFNPYDSVQVQINVEEIAKDVTVEGLETEVRTTHHSNQLDAIMVKLIKRDLLKYANMALAEMEETAARHLLGAKSHLEAELARIKALEASLESQ